MVLGKRKYSAVTSGKKFRSRRRRRMSRSRIPRHSTIVHSFKRKMYHGTVTTTYGAGATLGALTFNLAALPNYTEFTSLFDEYRILGILVEFHPGVDSWSAEPGVALTNMALPQVRTIIDHTEDGVPSSFNDMYQYANCKMTRGTTIHKRFLRPNVLSQAFESTVSTAYSPKYKQWITTDDATTPHYGLKYGIDALPSASLGTLGYRVYVTYYFQCKSTK